MAIDVTALSIYKDELSYGLAKKAILETDDIKFFDVRTDVNGQLQLNSVTSTMNGTNQNCSFSDSGTTVFAGNVLETADVNFYQNICAREAQKYYLGKFVAAEELGQSLGSLEEVIMDEKLGVVSTELERIRWQGDTANGSGNLALADGLLKKADDLSATTVNVPKSAMTASNAIAIVDAYASNIPSEIRDKEELRLFLSPSDFATYMKALRNANYFHVDANSANVTEFLHPGEMTLKVTKVNGLTGVASGRGIITTKENMVLGTLVDPNSIDASLWYSRDERQVKFAAEFRMGVQFVFGEHVVRIY